MADLLEISRHLIILLLGMYFGFVLMGVFSAWIQTAFQREKPPVDGLAFSAIRKKRKLAVWYDTTSMGVVFHAGFRVLVWLLANKQDAYYEVRDEGKSKITLRVTGVCVVISLLILGYLVFTTSS